MIDAGRSKSLFLPRDSVLNIYSLIALSGLNGHAFGSFKVKGDSFMWLRDSLPAKLPGTRILIYGYDTQLVGSRSFQILQDLGMSLRDTLHMIEMVSRAEQPTYACRS